MLLTAPRSVRRENLTRLRQSIKGPSLDLKILYAHLGHLYPFNNISTAQRFTKVVPVSRIRFRITDNYTVEVKRQSSQPNHYRYCVVAHLIRSGGPAPSEPFPILSSCDGLPAYLQGLVRLRLMHSAHEDIIEDLRGGQFRQAWRSYVPIIRKDDWKASGVPCSLQAFLSALKLGVFVQFWNERSPCRVCPLGSTVLRYRPTSPYVMFDRIACRGQPTSNRCLATLYA